MANALTDMVGGVFGGGKLTTSLTKLGRIDIIIYALIFSLLMFMIIRFVQHRRLVNIYIKVKSGYIKTAGRYEISNDKNTNIEYLRPIFGSLRLPNFPGKYWQKTKGLPLIGITRTINIVKLNSYTYKPIDIDSDTGNVNIIDYNTIGFTYMEEYGKFLREKRKADIMYVLSFVAPSVVIITTIAFFVLAMLGQANIEGQAATEMKRIAEAMINYATSR